MINTMETRISASSVRSLMWEGDVLIDWAAGGVRYGVDGEIDRYYSSFGPPFDHAIGSPSGDFVVLYGRLGTKALLLRGGKLLREINRSYYFAHAYEYPIALVRLKSGREAIIHCPDDYNRVEIDDLETGERLTSCQHRQPSDYFHSRLACSPDGGLLLSAGWLWHPLDEVRIYDIEAALGDPALLDADGLADSTWADQSSATFLRDGRLAVAVAGIDDDEADNSPELRLIDLSGTTPTSKVKLAARAGTMMAVGERYLLTLHGFPRLVNIETGLAEQSWPHLDSGLQTSSILTAPLPPPIALDHAGQRCAIADATGITILQF